MKKRNPSNVFVWIIFIVVLLSIFDCSNGASTQRNEARDVGVRDIARDIVSNTLSYEDNIDSYARELLFEKAKKLEEELIYQFLHVSSSNKNLTISKDEKNEFNQIRTALEDLEKLISSEEANTINLKLDLIEERIDLFIKGISKRVLNYEKEKEENIEKQKKRIQGKIAYRIQDSMFVNSISRVAMTISENNVLRDTIEKVIQNLTVVGNQSKSLKKDIKIESIEIGKKMRARLVDPQAPTFPAFNINPLSSETQLVDLYSEKPTLWQWDVYPIKLGDYILNLVVDVVILAEGKETPVTIPVFDKEVIVSANEINNSNILTVTSIDESENKKSTGDTLGLILISIVFLIFITAALVYRASINKVNSEKRGIYSVTEIIQKVMPNSFNEKKIKKLIEDGETEKALDLLDEKTKKNKEIQKKIIIHKSTLSNLKQANTIGTTTDENLNVGRTKINLALLGILDEIKTSD